MIFMMRIAGIFLNNYWCAVLFLPFSYVLLFAIVVLHVNVAVNVACLSSL